jgi:opacity protein-like surface antigen
MIKFIHSKKGIKIMKKIVLATLLALVAASASAVEVGVVGGTNFVTGSQNYGTGGITVGEHFGPFSVTAEALRQIKNNTNKYNLLAGYDVAKFGSATLTAKAGVAYIDNSWVKDDNRYAGVVGAGVTIPVTEKVSATVDYRYTDTKDAVSKYQQGNTVLVGAKYAF